MRKAQKQEILDTIQTLHEAHKEIKNYIIKNNNMPAQDILRLCQECAISIGTTIEKLEGEGFATIPYVEAYCEIAFVCHEELSNGAANADKIYKSLRKRLLRIESSVKNEVPVRKEIAFFPYKASMWDSLESVYLAAKKDGSCDVYCVPIPYYELNPDHSFGQMHYEGREYPKNIEVIDWMTYNFEERKPDEIYIHSPYDGWNLVTSVHPRFYSDNLKKYTDKLVYIPYFVLAEIEPDDQTAIDGMKQFIWMPGVINADEVILQSEKMKQIYVNEYLKAAKESGLEGCHTDRKYLENKFKGTGAPKIEKILRTKREDLEIPQEWKDVINKPDGGRKKVILYNTGLTALLVNNEKWVEKIEDSLRIFKENKDDVALLWRPHPLIENTMKSMRPWLLQRYTEIKNRYRAEGWGIYDDTADLDRAVALSDAYYGDGSSVVELYKAVGKPAMIASMDLRIDPKADCHNIRVSPAAFCVNDSDVWLVHSKFNVIFKYNLVSKETQTYSLNPYGDTARQSQFCGIHFYNAKLFIVPCWGREILVFDTNKLKIHVMQDGNVKAGSFTQSYTLGKYLYCIPFYGNHFFKIDMEDETIVKKFPWKNRENGEKLYINHSFKKGDEIYCIAPHMKNVLLKLENDTLYPIEINGEDDLYTACAALGKKIYLYGYNSQTVYEYDDVQKAPLNKYSLSKGSCIFTYVSDEILFHESGDKDELFYIRSNGKSEKIYVSSTDNGGYGAWYRAGVSVVEKDVCYYFDRRENVLYAIDGNYSTQRYEIYFDLDTVKKQDNGMIYESELQDIKYLITRLK